MSFIILVRNPRTKTLCPIVEECESSVMVECSTEDEAEKVARLIPICQAWGHIILEVES
jgi:hypothetical protein